jgi:hypothetical protein
MTPEQVDTISNGCGGKGIVDIVPDCILGANVRPACDIHDVEYWLGLDFHGANRRFFHNLDVLCDCDCAVTYLARRKICLTSYGVVCAAGRAFFGRGA